MNGIECICERELIRMNKGIAWNIIKLAKSRERTAVAGAGHHGRYIAKVLLQAGIADVCFWNNRCR